MTQDHPKGKQGFANYIWKAILAEWDNYGSRHILQVSRENARDKG